MARETGLTVSTCAGVIAALSPRVRWAQNIEYAWAVVRHRALGFESVPPVLPVFSRNRWAAWRIATGERPLSVLGGLKVRSFYRNIMGDAQAVTVDVWAGRAAGLERVSFTARQYALISRAYREAASTLGMRASDTQAAAWVVARGSAA